jgi:uncharacterized protein YjbI with pentapeptide repeats
MVWLGFFSNRSLQPEGDRLSQNENATLVPPDREPPVNNIGAIAAITGGIFLFLNVRLANRKTETANLSGADFKGKDLRGIDFSGVDLNGADLSGANLSDADLSSTDLSSTNLSGVDLSGANLSSANLSGADLISTNLKGANLSGADLRYANLSGADLRYANLSGADLRYANLSGADLNCTFLSKANFSDANLSGALLFFINSRGVLNLEPSQLKAQPSPLLCNVALPSYSSNPRVNPNRDCDRIPYVLSDRYNISLEEAQEIVNEARQHRWD